jgi:hypothetical protein
VRGWLSERTEGLITGTGLVLVIAALIWRGSQLYAWLNGRSSLFAILLVALPIATTVAALSQHSWTAAGLGTAAVVVFLMSLGAVHDSGIYHHSDCWELGSWPQREPKVYYMACAPGRYDAYGLNNGMSCDELNDLVGSADWGPLSFEVGEWPTVKRLDLAGAASGAVLLRCKA